MQSLDYSVKAALITGTTKAMSCQRCGCKSEESLCSTCRPPVVRHFQGHQKHVTSNGNIVLVNGVPHHTEETARLAAFSKRHLEKNFAARNLFLRKRGVN